SLVPVEAAARGYTLAGFLAPPRETLATARLVWTYVAVGGAGSGRWVRDRLLLRAVLDGYASLVMRGRYPIAILFLGIPPGEVDVNVHPAKLEVRCRSPAGVAQLPVPALPARAAWRAAACSCRRRSRSRRPSRRRWPSTPRRLRRPASRASPSARARSCCARCRGCSAAATWGRCCGPSPASWWRRGPAPPPSGPPTRRSPPSPATAWCASDR